MINDLKLSKIKSKSISIDGVVIEEKYVNDFITDIEIEMNYFRPFVMASMTCNEELFTLSINKSPELIKDSKIIMILQDNNDVEFIKIFYVHKAVKKTISSSLNMWEIILHDIYAKYLFSTSFSERITDKGYTGTPIEIIEKAMNDLIPSRYDACPIKFIRNNISFIDDNELMITHRFVKDKTPYENIKKFCSMYNIRFYQDNNSLTFIQNPTLVDMESSKATDGTPLYVEICNSKQYAFKICDKIRQPTSEETLKKVNYKLVLNEFGKKQTYKTLKFTDLMKILVINDNTKQYKDLIDENESYKPSNTKTLSSLVFSEFSKYLRTNTLIIYVRSTFEKANVGTLTSVELTSDKSLPQERAKGDIRWSGNWLITSSTIKIVGDVFFHRLILNRFDNPYENDGNNLISYNDEKTSENELTKDDIIQERNKILESARKSTYDRNSSI